MLRVFAFEIPEFAELGSIFRSSKLIELTEAETEYVVNCVKHIFPKHVVLQVDLTYSCITIQLVMLISHAVSRHQYSQ